MKTTKPSRAIKPLKEYADELAGEVLVLTMNNKLVAVLVSLAGNNEESFALSTNPEFLAIIKEARREVAAGHTFSFEEMKREVLP